MRISYWSSTCALPISSPRADAIGSREQVPGRQRCAWRLRDRRAECVSSVEANRSLPMITCFIRYPIDPFKTAQFETYARNWGEAIPRCGADLIGYFAPHAGSATTAYSVYSLESMAAYKAHRARLAPVPRTEKHTSEHQA